MIPYKSVNRRPRQGLMLLMANFLIVVHGPLNLPAAGGDPTRPDVVLIMLDDAGYTDFGVYGGLADTPNVDELAAAGIRFTDCHAAAPNCSPSRAGMLTGRFPARAGIYSYIPPRHPMHLRSGEVTIAEALKERGYATGHFGKWHLSQLEWAEDRNHPQPTDQGFDHSLGTTNNASPSHHNPTNFYRNRKPVGKISGYSCHIVADEFIDWSSMVAEDEPLLAVIWFNEPHTPIGSPPHLVDKYQSRMEEKDLRKARYLANIENVDMAVGRIRDQLDVLERSENTFLFLTSDNGGINSWSTMGLRGRKSHVYEGGHREPGILRWPSKIPPGQTCETPISHLDLFPTICDIAGAVPPPDRKMDGVSLRPLWEDGHFIRETPLFWFFYRVKPAAAMRDGDWVLTGYLNDPIERHTHPLTAPDMPMIRQAPLDQFELFNLRTDPEQQADLAGFYPDRLSAMKKRMQDLHREVVNEGPQWDLENWKP
jgi:arylsulfatase A